MNYADSERSPLIIVDILGLNSKIVIFLSSLVMHKHIENQIVDPSM